LDSDAPGALVAVAGKQFLDYESVYIQDNDYDRLRAVVRGHIWWYSLERDRE
jgi:hypothetical protein